MASSRGYSAQTSNFNFLDTVYEYESGEYFITTRSSMVPILTMLLFKLSLIVISRPGV